MNHCVASILSVLALSLASVTAAHADPILGSTITGALYFNGGSTNYFNPSTTTVTPAVEFSFSDAANTELADFGAFGFIITADICKNLPCNQDFPFTMTFTDTAFTGDRLVTTPAANNLDLTYSLVGDVITVHYNALTLPEGPTSSTFALISPAATPEPGSLALLGTGLAAIAGVARRRLFA